MAELLCFTLRWGGCLRDVRRRVSNQCIIAHRWSRAAHQSKRPVVHTSICPPSRSIRGLDDIPSIEKLYPFREKSFLPTKTRRNASLDEAASFFIPGDFSSRHGKQRDIDRDVHRTLRNDSSITSFPLLLIVCDFVRGGGKHFLTNEYDFPIRGSSRPLLTSSCL